MRLLSLEVKNFKRLSGERKFTFQDGITSIVGSNGRGKSTIANAIAWALYGPAALESNKEDVITWGEKSCLVMLEFEIDNQVYVIRRSQKANGTSNAEINRDRWNGDVIAMGIDPTNREVERLLGVDRVGFLVSVYSQQEELDGLVSLTPANRKKVVLRLLGIERLTSAIEEVRSDARDARKVLDGLLAGQSESIEEIDARIADLREQRRIIDADIWSLQVDETEHLEKHNDLLAQQEALIPKRKAYEDYRKRRESAEIALRVAESELESAVRARESVVPPVEPGPSPEPVDPQVLSDLSAESGRLGIRKGQAEYQIQSAFCITCKRPFENAEEQAENARAELAEIEDQLQTVYDEYNSKKEQINAYQIWLSKWEEFNRASANSVTAAERVQNASAAVATARRALDTIEPVEDSLAASEALHAAVLESATGAARIRQSLSTLAERGRQSKAEESSLVERRKKMISAQDKITEAQQETLYNETTATLLGKLKDSLISDIVPNLASRASTLVSEFTDGKYTELSLTPDYEVQFRNYRGDLKAFSNLSGGEKDIFALSLRLAIADLRAERVGLLILDEVIESLDPERQESTWQAIERLGARYDQILFITHSAGFRDRATQVISV